MRIISDELWARVKERQLATLANFSRTTTNRLNRTHRPSYLLSGMLECAECGGSYAIMAKERYGCSNQKTILRKNLEERVPQSEKAYEVPRTVSTTLNRSSCSFARILETVSSAGAMHSALAACRRTLFSSRTSRSITTRRSRPFMSSSAMRSGAAGRLRSCARSSTGSGLCQTEKNWRSCCAATSPRS
ncbi:hypothetical protein [Rhizobium binxianense]